MSQYRLSSNLCGLDLGEDEYVKKGLNTASAVTFVVKDKIIKDTKKNRLNTASAVTFVVTYFAK